MHLPYAYDSYNSYAKIRNSPNQHGKAEGLVRQVSGKKLDENGELGATELLIGRCPESHRAVNP